MVQLSPEHVNPSVALGENEFLIVERVNLHCEQNLHGDRMSKIRFYCGSKWKGTCVYRCVL